MSYSYKHKRPACAADCAIFGWDGELKIILIERDDPPFSGMLSLPGSFIRCDAESPQMTATRAVKEKTGVEIRDLFVVGYYGNPTRDPRGHTISVAYGALVCTPDALPAPGRNARSAKWHPVSSIGTFPMAFDHLQIIQEARAVLAERMHSTPAALNVLPQKFRISDLRDLFAGVTGAHIDPRNFAANFKRLVAAGVFVQSGLEKNVPHRPGALYSYDPIVCQSFLDGGGRFSLGVPAVIRAVSTRPVAYVGRVEYDQSGDWIPFRSATKPSAGMPILVNGVTRSVRTARKLASGEMKVFLSPEIP